MRGPSDGGERILFPTFDGDQRDGRSPGHERRDDRLVADDGVAEADGETGAMVLDHLKVKPGEKIEVDLLLDGCCVLRGPRSGDISEFFGILADVPVDARAPSPSRR
ncbi:hypothetical protein Ddc_19762 [Ditylenchus destructor]|nr:hypothetical protein Ddc_19762 [Ditylenchus destructor]